MEAVSVTETATCGQRHDYRTVTAVPSTIAEIGVCPASFTCSPAANLVRFVFKIRTSCDLTAQAPKQGTRVKAEQPGTGRLVGVSVLAVCLTAPLAAEPRAAGPPAGPPAHGIAAVRAMRLTSILGGAWNADNSPIPEARLRLRNAITGRIEATTVADTAGRFTFSNVERGTYLIELVNEHGKVLTVGRAFVVAPGETVATFVRLGSRAPWYAGFFENAATAATSAAAGLGVTARAPVARPVSAKR